MALGVEILYAINCGFVKTRFSETIFIDASALFVVVSFSNLKCKCPIRTANSQLETKLVFPIRTANKH